MRVVWLTLLASLLIAAQSQNIDELKQRASALLQTNPSEAAQLCRQALNLQPSWAEGWFDLGAALFELRQYAESQKAFQRAAQLAPAKGAVWAFLGLCEYELPDYPRALSDIEKGEKLGLPDNKQFVSAVHNRAALISIHAGDFSRAIEQLKPLALLGDNSRATIQAFGVSALGMSYLPPDVPAEKRPLIELAGRAEWALSADRDAGTLIEQLRVSYPDEPGVHYLAGLFKLAHDPEAARAEFQKELEIRPSNVAAQLQIAILDIKAGEPEKAVTLARAALAIDRQNALAHAVLGRAYMDKSEWAKAIPELEAAANLAPDNPQIHLHLQRVYRELGRTADAQREMAEYTRLRSVQQPGALPDLK